MITKKNKNITLIDDPKKSIIKDKIIVIENHQILEQSKTIKRIAHVSDTHIPKEKMYSVYKTVFDRLFQDLKNKNINNEDSLIVVTGDIINDKAKLSAQSVELVKYLFTGLSNLCDCIVIIGNHDRDNDCNLDSISPIIKNSFLTKHKIHMLLDNQTYEYGNIVFGHTCMESSIVTECKGFDDKIKIALYHGIIHGCTNEDGKDLGALAERDRFNLNAFSDYKYKLFGDVHKFQYLDAKKSAWYPSSLIQQNRGEHFENHGYVLLDLPTDTSEFIKIKNDYGYINITLEADGTIDFPLDKLPKYSDIRIICKTADNEIKKEIKKKIEERTIIQSYIPISNYSGNGFDSNIMIGKDSQNLLDIKDNLHLKNVILNFIKENQKLNDGIYKRISKKIDDIIRTLHIDEKKDSKNIIFKSLEFSNISLYDEDNKVIFSKMKGIAGISANNSAGKTSFCECIPIALYGICPRGTRADFVRKGAKRAHTEIIVEVNSITYTIRREFKRNNKSTQVTEHVTINKNTDKIFDNDEKEEDKKNEDVNEADDIIIIECEPEKEDKDSDEKLENAEYHTEGKLNATQLVNNLICSYEDLYMTMMVGQPRTINFITNPNKSELIFKYAGLDIFNKLGEIAGNNATTMTQKCGIIYNNRTLDDIVGRGKPKKGVPLNEHRDTEINKAYETIKEKKNKIENEKQILEDGINIYDKELEIHSEKKIRLEEQLKKYDLNELGENVNENKYIIEFEDVNRRINKINLKQQNENINKKEEELIRINQKIAKYDNIVNDKKIFDINKKENISSLNKKIKELISQIKPINYGGSLLQKKSSKNISSFEIASLITLIPKYTKQNKELETQQNKIQKMIEELINKLNFENIEEIKENHQKYDDNQNSTQDLQHKYNTLKNNLDQTDKLLFELNEYEYDLFCKQCIQNSSRKTKEQYEDAKKQLLKQMNEISSKIKEENEIKQQQEQYKIKYQEYLDFIENSRTYQKQITELKQQIEKINRQISSNDNEIQNIETYTLNNDIHNQIDKMESEIDELENEVFEDYDEYEEIKQQQNELREEISELKLNFEKNKNMTNTLENKRTELADKIKQIEENKEKYNEYKKNKIEYENVNKQYQQMYNKQVINRNEQKEKEREFLKINSQYEIIKNASEQYNDYKQNREEYEILQKMLTHDNGLIRKILKDQILPKMENTVNQMLATIGFNELTIQLAVNKNKRKMNNIIIKTKGESDIAINRKGYFESSMIEMVFRMALSQINQFVKTNCIIVDEIYDGCANENKEKVTTLIEYFKEYYQFMIVISHNEDIVKLFDSRIIIKNKDGISHIEVK